MDVKWWHDIAVLNLPVIEKILRAVLVYAFLVVGFRLAGKRALAPTNPLDLIVLLTISNAVQNAIIGDDNSVVGGFISGSTLLLLNYLLIRFLYRHPKAEKLLEGESSLLIKHGEIQTKILENELISRNELTVSAHKQGLASLSEVWNAELETDGEITFVSKQQQTEEARHKQVMTQLEHLAQEITLLKKAQGHASTP